MNILILNWKDIKNPEVGGAEVIAFEFAQRLVREGHHVTFFTRTFPHCRQKELINGVTVIRRGGRLSVYLHAFLFYRSSHGKFDRVIDMVNTICWQTPLYVPKEKRIAYVNQLAKEVFFFELPFPLSLIAYYIERFEYILYKSTQFACYSQSTKEDLIAFGIPSKNIHVFPLGVDHKRYIPQKNMKSKYPLFIFVARLVKMKRADLCIEAVSKIIQEYPSIKLYIIGNGEEERSLIYLVKRKKIENNIHFITKNNFFFDKKKGDIKVLFMQKAWALLLPSVKEGWGMVVTEAGACGTPSIVSNVTGLRDSVIHNKTGVVLSANPTADELAEELLRFIKNRKIRTKLSREAIHFAKKLNWEISYRKFKSIILR